MASEIYAAWRAAGIVAAVRVNPLEGEGRADLAEIMRGRPDVVIMSKVANLNMLWFLYCRDHRYLPGALTSLHDSLVAPPKPVRAPATKPTALPVAAVSKSTVTTPVANPTAPTTEERVSALVAEMQEGKRPDRAVPAKTADTGRQL